MFTWANFTNHLLEVGLGALHTRAKSREHGIVRAQKKVSKGRPKADQTVWSPTLKCRVKSFVTGPSTKFYFNECLFMWVLTHIK